MVWGRCVLVRRWCGNVAFWFDCGGNVGFWLWCGNTLGYGSAVVWQHWVMVQLWCGNVGFWFGCGGGVALKERKKDDVGYVSIRGLGLPME